MAAGNWPTSGFFYYNSEFDVDYWWSGTAGCNTTFSGVSVEVAGGIIDEAKSLRDDVLVTGVSELGCHGTTSQHYCGHAVDIWCNGWSQSEIDAMESYADTCGYSFYGPGDDGHDDHIHIGSGSFCQAQ